MKSCPKCNRTFPDEGQKFCTFDGGLLIAPQPTFDPNATMRATSIDLNAASERPTSRDLPDPNATIIESYPATVALPRNTGPTGPPPGAPTTADISKPAPPPPPPPPVSPPPTPPVSPPPAQTSQPLPPPPAPQQTSAPLPTSAPLHAPAQLQASAPLPAPPAAQKKSKMPWIIAGVLLFLLLGGGALAGAFFFIIKPRLDQVAERRQEPVVQPTVEAAPSPSPSVEPPPPTPEFVPPPNTVPFENSAATLDGKLAEHYFDFSFYYPKSWQRDPTAGVPGARNFVKVERRESPDSAPQEDFAVGWYTSTGTFAGDSANFPQRVEEVSAALAKAYPEYRKLSEGPTKVNSMDAYEFRWQGLSKADNGDIKLWGRVVFLPTGKDGDTAGATIVMLSTSLAPELTSAEDIGEKGEAKVILDSFRFGKK